MENLPAPEVLKTESDVEQKFAWTILTNAPPHGFGFDADEIFTKPDIRDFEIEKGQAAKRYFPGKCPGKCATFPSKCNYRTSFPASSDFCTLRLSVGDWTKTKGARI